MNFEELTGTDFTHYAPYAEMAYGSVRGVVPSDGEQGAASAVGLPRVVRGGREAGRTSVVLLSGAVWHAGAIRWVN